MKIHQTNVPFNPNEEVNVTMTMGEIYLINRLVGCQSNSNVVDIIRMHPSRERQVNESIRELSQHIVKEQFSPLYTETNKLLMEKGWIFDV